MEPPTSEEESAARLRGLMAMLTLPPRQMRDGSWRRPVVEVEVYPGLWEQVEELSVTSEAMTFSRGANGHRVEFVFRRAEGVPAWRTPDIGGNRS